MVPSKLSLPFVSLRSWGCVQYGISVWILKLKSHELSFVNNICLSGPIILKFCTEHDSDTVMFCAKFQEDWIIEMGVMDKRDFARFELRWFSDEYTVLHATPAFYHVFQGTERCHHNDKISKICVIQQVTMVLMIKKIPEQRKLS